jgi:2-polyprenyl-3-methyl-5-hydroxy-6-metoxy-1,4-benzoquinol methylase
MAANSTEARADESRKIEYLSPATEVRMADQWYEIASLEHFWIQRRFEVLRRLCGNLISSTVEMAEMGCGQGLLQRQIEDAYDKPVAGFDLNEQGLKHNVSRLSRLCCYNIHQRNQELQGKFNVILLFDVLEHIPDEDEFLGALLFHLSPGGRLILNVPAGRWAFSEYDAAAGHLRRYTLKDLRAVALRNNLEIENWTWWGLPLIPLLAMRKIWLMGKDDQRQIIATGFDSKAPSINWALGMLARMEWTPQALMGTSLMAVLRGGRESG